MKLISVVLPTYNGSRYLKQSIESVLSQTYTNLELIVVNDCSTDHTQEIATEFMQRDTRVKLINNETNSKLPKSLNNGFAIAKGEYITWTSDDNYYLPSAIEKMKNYLDSNPNCALVACNFTKIDEHDEFIHDYELKLTLKEMLIGNQVGACFMYRKEIAEKVGEYNVNRFLIEDYEYWLRLGLKGELHHLPEVLYVYRLHQSSLTTTRVNEVERKKYQVLEEFIPLYLQQHAELRGDSDISKTLATCKLHHFLETKNINLLSELQQLFTKKELYTKLISKYYETANPFYDSAIRELGVFYKVKSKVNIIKRELNKFLHKAKKHLQSLYT